MTLSGTIFLGQYEIENLSTTDKNIGEAQSCDRAQDAVGPCANEPIAAVVRFVF